MDNVAGVKIPKFEQFTEGVDTKMALTGLGAGGKAIQACSLHPEQFSSPKRSAWGSGVQTFLWSVCLINNKLATPGLLGLRMHLPG
jgi:hypothetical protein